MQGLTRRWVFRDPAATAEMDRLPLPKRILHARGLRDPDVLRQFCEPKLTDLYDPELMPGLEMAATRLVAAVRSGESIAIYGDYDVDGITASAIVYHTVKVVSPESDIRIYIPHRIDEGYGLNGDALRHLRAGGVDLVISVDCGITAIEPARVARSIGLDLIITDHHNLPASDGAIPEALAVVHPRLPGSEPVSLRRAVRRRHRVQARLEVRDDLVRVAAGRQLPPADAAEPASAGRPGDDRRYGPAGR